MMRCPWPVSVSMLPAMPGCAAWSAWNSSSACLAGAGFAGLEVFFRTIACIGRSALVAREGAGKRDGEVIADALG